MDVVKPIKINAAKVTVDDQPLTSVEMGKLWATFMGNSMAIRILSFFLQHVKDDEIKALLENGLALSKDIIGSCEGFFKKRNFPIPKGFTEEDVDLKAPRLYQDEFYVHYLKYAAKAGLSIYSVAIPLIMKKDIRNFFVQCANSTATFLEQINNILMKKGLIIQPPIIPVPDKIDFVNKQKFLNGFVGDVRPLHALEITHLYDNIENNNASKALLMGFHQVVKDDKIRKLFQRGLDMTENAVKQYTEKLHIESLPAPSPLDHLVTTSTKAPFSDKIMLFHKVDMFSMKIRAFGNSLAVNGRRDIGLLYTRTMANIMIFVDDATNLLIEHEWMEQPPHAVDRDRLTAE